GAAVPARGRAAHLSVVTPVAGTASAGGAGTRPHSPDRRVGRTDPIGHHRRMDHATDRAVLVTGASRGIGQAVATAFAANGDRVAIHHRSSPGLAEDLRDRLPGKGHTVVCADLTDAAAVRTMVDTAADRLGGLDVLVNNAGVFLAHPILETSYERWQELWRQTLETNLVGAANVTWCAVRHMRRGGRIVNVSSRGAFRGEPECPAYGASKAGLNALGQSLAVALAPRGRDPRPEPVPPGGPGRGGRRRGAVAGVAGRRVGLGRHPGSQRRLIPAQLTRTDRAPRRPPSGDYTR